MSTLAFTVSAGVVAVLAMFWLIILDRPQTARVERLARRAPASQFRVHVLRSRAYRPTRWYTKCKALIGLGFWSTVLGVVLALVCALVLGGALFFLRNALT